MKNYRLLLAIFSNIFITCAAFGIIKDDFGAATLSLGWVLLTGLIMTCGKD